jgi:hypothetical protein
MLTNEPAETWLRTPLSLWTRGQHRVHCGVMVRVVASEGATHKALTPRGSADHSHVHVSRGHPPPLQTAPASEVSGSRRGEGRTS